MALVTESSAKTYVRPNRGLYISQRPSPKGKRVHQMRVGAGERRLGEDHLFRMTDTTPGVRQVP
jgi:hypothetical protein